MGGRERLRWDHSPSLISLFALTHANPSRGIVLYRGRVSQDRSEVSASELARELGS